MHLTDHEQNEMQTRSNSYMPGNSEVNISKMSVENANENFPRAISNIQQAIDIYQM